MKMKKIFDSPTFWGIILGIIMILLMINWLETRAQAVVLRNDTFICVDSVKSKPHPTMTKYFYLKDGNTYPIYATANGKCFIIKTSKKTGKQYKHYLPEVSKRLFNGNR